VYIPRPRSASPLLRGKTIDQLLRFQLNHSFTHILHSYFRQLQAQVRSPGASNGSINRVSKRNTSKTPKSPNTPEELQPDITPNRLTPSSVPSNTIHHPDSEVPLERDDWWYKGTDNLFLNRSGEHRTTISCFPSSRLRIR